MNEMTSSLLGNGDSDSSCLTSSTTCTSLLFSEESLVVSDDSFLEEVKKNAIKRKVIKPRLSVSVMRSTARRSSDGNSPVAVPIPRKSIALQSPLLDSLQVKTHSPLTSRPSVQPDSVVDSHTGNDGSLRDVDVVCSVYPFFFVKSKTWLSFLLVMCRFVGIDEWD